MHPQGAYVAAYLQIQIEILRLPCLLSLLFLAQPRADMLTDFRKVETAMRKSHAPCVAPLASEPGIRAIDGMESA